MNILIECMQGIGDTIYSRPFLRKLAETNTVYAKSVLPDLLNDIPNLRLLKAIPTLRTQTLHLLTADVKYAMPPSVFDLTMAGHYRFIGNRSIPGAIEHGFGLPPMTAQDYRKGMILPRTLPDHYLNLPVDRKIAVIRPVTIRKEWAATSRAPEPGYIGWCSKLLKQAGYYVVSIADCDDENEWIEGSIPQADLYLHKGELGILGALALIKKADVVIGGSGFIIPAAIAAGVPLFIIFGGRGAYDAPQRVFDLRMNLSKVGWAIPDNFCRCDKMIHDCDKTITNLDDKFYTFMSRL